MRKRKFVVMMVVIFCLWLTGCGNASGTMKDGYYTAEMGSFSHGWKEYVCILVKNDRIISIEFNAKDPSGFIKAWDNNYMENMKTINGTYPNEYTRLYGNSLIELQDIGAVDIVTGATTSGDNFYRLVDAAIEQAKEGNPEVIVVD